MAKRLKVNKSQLRTVASKLAFAPSEAGPLKVVVDAGNADYWTNRAVEFILQHLETKGTEPLYAAAQLLVLAIAKLEADSDPEIKLFKLAQRPGIVKDEQPAQTPQEAKPNVTADRGLPRAYTIRLPGNDVEDIRGWVGDPINSLPGFTIPADLKDHKHWIISKDASDAEWVEFNKLLTGPKT